jgi:hypothetical protein
MISRASGDFFDSVVNVQLQVFTKGLGFYDELSQYVTINTQFENLMI